MSTLKKTADGKVDKRTKEYKELVERAKKARQAKARASRTTTKATTAKTTARSTASKTTSTAKKPATSSVKDARTVKWICVPKKARRLLKKWQKLAPPKTSPKQQALQGLSKSSSSNPP